MMTERSSYTLLIYAASHVETHTFIPVVSDVDKAIG